MLNLTDDQELIVQSARQFCADPKIQQLVVQAAMENRPPREVWDEAAKLGFVGLGIPVEYGGGGFDLVTECLVIQEFFSAGNPFASMLVAHNLGLKCLYYCGTEQQKKKWLVPMAKGEILCTSAITDPAGSFNYKEWGTTFVRDGDEYVVNGGKVMVTQAAEGDVKFVFAMDYDGDGIMKGLIIDGDAPGVTSAPQAKLVPSGDGWGSLNFSDVRIPADNIVDTANSDIPFLAPGFLEVGFSGILIAQACMGLALQYATQRTRYGKPLTNLQKVVHRIVDMGIKVESARSLAFDAAQKWDAGQYEEANRLCMMVKVLGTETSTAVSHDAMLLYGGLGVTPEVPVAALYLTATSLEIAEGTNDILRDFIGETYGMKTGWKNGQR